MTVNSLDLYCSPEGFQIWSFDTTVKNLDEEDRIKLVNAARRNVEVYGPFDNSKGSESISDLGVTRFEAMMCELIYTIAEILYYYKKQSSRTIISDVRSERIGSYSYTTGGNSAQNTHPSRQIIEDNDQIMSFINHLKDNSSVPMSGSTIVLPFSFNEDINGRRSFIDAFDNRVASAIDSGLITSRTEYIQRVYS